MDDRSSTADQSQPALPPPPKSRNPWKIVAIVLGVLVGVFVLLAVIGSQTIDNRDEKLAEKLPASIEANFRDKGIDVTVLSVECEKLPTNDAAFSIQCGVRIEGIDEIVETTVQGSVNDDLIEVEEVFSEERLLSIEKAVEYVQNLVNGFGPGITVMDCDLGGDVAVIRTGSQFTCTLDSNETIEITVKADGSGEITEVLDGGGD